ncbi:unnamed protein product [Spodoptera littoralis]|uniref:Ribosomal RNA-processing protein 8 n=1 Tax=Spodoptera littoralis TaxID=7109 RepID=A0A9P0MVK8_SPOLI|nr:unnamed protein product [Spodoptera littoralis]CAH1634981.1 unnamed protein product [Spodoptera littoralis]
MMFKIPAWEDDVPKTDAIALPIMKKVKKKAKSTTDNNKQTKVDNNVKEKNDKIKGQMANGPKKAAQKRKIEQNTTNKTKKDTTPNKKRKKIEEDVEIPESQNFDEVLLNAKKKKFNQVIENDDKEDVLFTEKKQKSNKKKKVKNGIVDTKDNNSNSKIVKNLKSEGNSEVVENVERVDKKKARFKQLLDKTSSLRRPINTSNTGNKLRDRMLERLKAAQFRYLNEKLYTSSGSEAQQLFQNDPNAFETYHQGYQLQVKKWPVNPLDVIIKKIMKMPKTHTIADLGCGEAALSRRVPHKVRSFDLVATAPGVEACDMARTPLLSASMDVTVYCLALMGTDLTQYLLEANRVLKMGGHLLIAEVESRFDKVEDFAKEVERLGFKLKQLDKSNKVFYFMEFTKIRDPPVKKAKLPALTLKPCLYKRR